MPGARNMRIEPEIGGANVVVVGNFNPAIFTPAWFALHGLLPKNAADNADVGVIGPDFAAFSFDWLILEVTSERFVARTAQEPFVRVRDLVTRVFDEHLFHTPVRALGINREVHFRAGSLAARDRIGRALAPVEPWGIWGQELGLDGLHGGLTSLTMSQFKPDGRPAGGEINVKVERSVVIGDKRFGVYVRVNDHYALGEADERSMTLLEKNFEPSLKRSDGIIDHVMSLSEQRTG